MKFGKAGSPDQLKSLIQSPLAQFQMGGCNWARATRPRIYLGAPLWGKKEWVGKLYPPKTQPRDYLRYYALQMNSIELNTTFYRIPAESTVLNWKSSVPEDFRFCPKVYQGISQFGQLVQIPELTQRFFESVQHFGQQLGICFLQLPPHFGPDRILILKRFFKLLPSQIRLAIEFRHPGWFQNHRLVGSVFELLSEFQISTVMTDAVGRTDVLHTSLSTPRVMIRFLGNSLHPSDYSRLDQWIGALGQWFEGGVEEVYFFVHQPEEEGVIELVQYVVESLNERYGSAFDIRLQGIDLQRAQPQIELL